MGFYLAWRERPPIPHGKTHVSVVCDAVHIDSYIDKESALGALMSRFQAVPYSPWAHVNPLMTCLKKDSDKGRVITDPSMPAGHSINDSTPADSRESAPLRSPLTPPEIHRRHSSYGPCHVDEQGGSPARLQAAAHWTPRLPAHGHQVARTVVLRHQGPIRGLYQFGKLYHVSTCSPGTERSSPQMPPVRGGEQGHGSPVTRRPPGHDLVYPVSASL